MTSNYRPIPSFTPRSRNSFSTRTLALQARRFAHQLYNYARGPGRRQLSALCFRFVRQVGRNLTSRRVVSFPHLLVLVWMVIMLWGERWVFESKVHTCAWENWEKWPREAKPHHLIFVADPQIIDPHSYPGRPWPLSAITVAVTDNYLRRGYGALQSQLQPDSVFFLGDLFDGGREWKTRQGTEFVDPKLGEQRADDEKGWVDTWHRKYGEDFWLKEYHRFGSIFFDQWGKGGDSPGSWQRGKKLVASLPGNHDLGFGAQVQIAVRDRFEAFFGDVNRVDVVGNHTIVSVDSVSLSADSSEFREGHDLTPIYGPVNQFLDNVQVAKRKAVQQDLDAWHGRKRDTRYWHDVEDLEASNLGRLPKTDPGAGGPDFPTILLTHVPLYRDVGTPCGKLREHWPPTKPPKGQTEPVFPDERNAIGIFKGYQYQNVLSEEDSVKLVKKIGNVVHVFSGDDHDYCELRHSDAKDNVKEITVKSISMAMGVPTPGFVMASLYNPVDEHGRALPGASGPTIQTHLCLLPNQYGTYMRYISFLIVTLVILSVRAYLVPVLHLTPFALDPDSTPVLLPVHKHKVEPPDHPPRASYGASSLNDARFSGTTRSLSNGHHHSSSGGSSNRRGATGSGGWGYGPKIDLQSHDFYDVKKQRQSGRAVLSVVGRELWTTSWRTTWMVALFWVYLTRKG